MAGAFDDGYKARQAGKPRISNPYDECGWDSKYFDWDEGWEEANQDIFSEKLKEVGMVLIPPSK